jgi:hypothetical protein
VNLIIALAALFTFAHADQLQAIKRQIKKMDLLMLKEQGFRAVTDICAARCFGKIATCADEWPSWDLKELTALAQKSVNSDFQVKMRSLKVVEETKRCIGFIEVSSAKNGSSIIHVDYDLFGASRIRENLEEPPATEEDVKAAEEEKKAAYPKYLAAKKEAEERVKASQKAEIEKEAREKAKEEAEERAKEEARKKARGPEVEPPLTVKIPPRLEDDPEFKLPKIPPADTRLNR